MRITPYLVMCSVLLLASGQAPAPSGGTITGAVTMDHAGKPINAKNAKDIWVYLEEIKPRPGVPGKNVFKAITQKKQTFDPPVLVVPRGATVGFPNKDKEPHNVFSPAIGTKPMWDLGRYGPNKTNTRKFLELAEYEIYCDIHRDMSARIKVVPTRDFAPANDGNYKLENVPPGRYKVVAWAPGSKDVRSEVIEVRAGATAAIPPINLHWDPLPTVHLRMDGTEYGAYR